MWQCRSARAWRASPSRMGLEQRSIRSGIEHLVRSLRKDGEAGANGAPGEECDAADEVKEHDPHRVAAVARQEGAIEKKNSRPPACCRLQGSLKWGLFVLPVCSASSKARGHRPRLRTSTR
eukprot:scaffold19276_cov51-Phaeocystis_antarctica.AAC.3